MATQIDQLRSIVQDKPAHVIEPIAFDGATKTFRLGYYPIVLGSVTVTPAPDTVDADKGVLTYAAAPAGPAATVEYDTVMLSDIDIQNIIDVQNSLVDSGVADIRLVAAMVLDAMASNQALILKRITLQDLQTDGSTIAKALHDFATTLRGLVYDIKYQESTFDIIEQINDYSGYAEKILKDVYRSEI